VPTEPSATSGGSLTVAPAIPGVGMVGVSITIYPGNYGVPDQPTVTITGILGGTFSGPTAGYGRPFGIEGVFLTPGTSASDTLGAGYTGNISAGGTVTLDYGVTGKLLAVQGGLAASLGVTGAPTYTLSGTQIVGPLAAAALQESENDQAMAAALGEIGSNIRDTVVSANTAAAQQEIENDQALVTGLGEIGSEISNGASAAYNYVTSTLNSAANTVELR